MLIFGSLMRKEKGMVFRERDFRNAPLFVPIGQGKERSRGKGSCKKVTKWDYSCLPKDNLPVLDVEFYVML